VSGLLGDRGRVQRLRRPLAKLQAYKRRMGWTFPWASSFGGDFNFDFNVGFTEEQQREGGIEYNYRREAARQQREGSESGDEGSVVFAAMSGTDAATYTRERPGMSAFAMENGVVYHTYSTYARGLDGPLGHVSVARPRAEGAQRDGRLVAPPRRVQSGLSERVMASSHRRLRRRGRTDSGRARSRTGIASRGDHSGSPRL
jgi:Bacterial protein of unknown function (DUF899)